MELPFQLSAHNPVVWIIGYYLCLNLLLYGMMFVDKRRAQKNQWRIRERTLLLLALFGGCIGGLAGMVHFHHKNKHFKFVLIYTLSLILHAVLWVQFIF